MLKFIFTFILLTTVLSEPVAQSHARECGRVVPGAERMASGIDLSTFNIFTILSPASNPNFLQPVLKYTCDQNKTYVNPNNQQVYDVPDQISVITMLGGGQLDFTNFAQIFTYDLKAQMAAELESDSFFGLFSSSTEFDAAYSLNIAEGSMIGQVASQISSYEILFHPQEAQPNLFNLTEDAFYYVNEIAKSALIFNETTFPKYEQYFAMMGTHHFSKADFGGLLRLGWFTSKLFASSTSTGQLGIQAGFSFFNFIIDSGGFSGSKKTVDNLFISNTKFVEKCLGGNGGCPNSPAAWTAWANSVSGNPWLFSGAIQPNYKLIQNPILQASMMAATWNHFYRAFLMKEVPLALSIVKAQLPAAVHQEGQCVSQWIDKIKPCKSFVDPAPAFNGLASTLTTKIQSLNTEIDQLLGKCSAIIAKSPIVDLPSVLAIGNELVDILRRVESLPTVTSCHFHATEFLYYSPGSSHGVCISCSAMTSRILFCDDNDARNTPAFIRYLSNL